MTFEPGDHPRGQPNNAGQFVAARHAEGDVDLGARGAKRSTLIAKTPKPTSDPADTERSTEPATRRERIERVVRPLTVAAAVASGAWTAVADAVALPGPAPIAPNVALFVTVAVAAAAHWKTWWGGS
jgi:hypothetical protein